MLLGKLFQFITIMERFYYTKINKFTVRQYHYCIKYRDQFCDTSHFELTENWYIEQELVHISLSNPVNAPKRHEAEKNRGGYG